MRLSEFIESTLMEIAIGVERARLQARDLVAINPSQLDGEQLTEKSYVEFDVSVLVGENEEQSRGRHAKASIEIKVASVGGVGGSVGGKGEATSSARAEQTHKVSFRVPLYMNANYRNNPAAQAEAASLEHSADR